MIKGHQSTRIPEDQARALWQRAIELQLEAERKGEDRSLPPGGPSGFALEEIVHAAEGAGIDPAHVLIAVAERRLPEADQARRDRWSARWQRVLLRVPDALEASALVAAPLDQVLEVFSDVVARPAFALTLEDRVGPAPPLDGVLVYRIERPSLASSSFHDGMMTADARVVLLTARERDGTTELRLRVPAFEHGVNLALTGGIAGGLGTAGGWGGAMAGSVLAGALGTASALVLAGPLTVGALAGASIGLAAARAGSRWGRRRGARALHRLLQTVAVEVESDVFES